MYEKSFNENQQKVIDYNTFINGDESVQMARKRAKKIIKERNHRANLLKLAGVAVKDMNHHLAQQYIKMGNGKPGQVKSNIDYSNKNVFGKLAYWGGSMFGSNSSKKDDVTVTSTSSKTKTKSKTKSKSKHKKTNRRRNKRHKN
jgi:hypothetical protein